MKQTRNIKSADKAVAVGKNGLSAESRSAIRSRNLAEYYSVELSDKKASRKILDKTSYAEAQKKYADYDL